MTDTKTSLTSNDVAQAKCYCGRYLIQHAPAGHRTARRPPDETNRDKVLRGEVVKVTDDRLRELQRIARANEGFGRELYHWHWVAVVNELIGARAEIERLTKENEKLRHAINRQA